MKITYRHYRVPDFITKVFKLKHKGDPPYLARFMRGYTKWKPYERGGRTACFISDDAGDVIAVGDITCFMEDHFCYKEGRERALENAYENMVQGCTQRSADLSKQYDELFAELIGDLWRTWGKEKYFSSSEAVARKEMEQSFRAAFEGQGWRERDKPSEDKEPSVVKYFTPHGKYFARAKIDKAALKNIGLDIKVDSTGFVDGLNKVQEKIQDGKDATMRRSLLRMMWYATHIYTEGSPELPFPEMDDDQVCSELKRILGE
jgi:hypothetical protein